MMTGGKFPSTNADHHGRSAMITRFHARGRAVSGREERAPVATSPGDATRSRRDAACRARRVRVQAYEGPRHHCIRLRRRGVSADECHACGRVIWPIRHTGACAVLAADGIRVTARAPPAVPSGVFSGWDERRLCRPCGPPHARRCPSLSRHLRHRSAGHGTVLPPRRPEVVLALSC